MSKRKAPPGCYWRGNTLWGKAKIRGVRVRWPLRTSNADIAARRQKARADQLRAEAYFGEVRHSYESGFTKWAAWIVDQVAPESSKRYAVSLRQLEPFLRGLHQEQINGACVSGIITARKAAGVTITTIRRDLTALSSYMTFCETEGMRDDNPALNWLRRLRERRDPIRLPNPAHVDRVIARTPGMLPQLIKAARLTGCRLTELAFAKRSQFDRARRQLTLYGKGNKARVIDLEPFGAFELFDSLPAYLAEPWLFWHGQGEPYRNVSSRFAGYVKAELQAAVEKAGPGRTADFDPFTFHHLRHLHAVEWLKSGRNIYVLQQRMGHSSIKTTELYLKFLTAEEIQIVKYGRSGPTAEQQQQAG